jgi:probable HAF family extracellular repeat protein
MNTKLHALISGVAVFTALVLPFRMPAQTNGTADPQAKHHRYKLEDLGTLGGPQSVIFDLTGPLSSQGSVTACADLPTLDQNNPQTPYLSYDPYLQHAVLWSDGKLKDLGTLPGGGSSCSQWINGWGWTVGGSENGTIDALTEYPEVNAALWKNGKTRNLGTLGGNESVAFGINNLGAAVGFALNTIPDSFTWSLFAFGATQAHAFLWKGGAMQDLGTLGGPDSIAFYINERGQVSGLSQTNSIPNDSTGMPTLHTFFWEEGKMVDVGSLGGTLVYVNDMNNRGEVVGQSYLAGDQTSRPYMWKHGVLTDLGTFGGDNGSAIWVNDAGQIVGVATVPIPCAGCLMTQVYHAAAWEDGVMADLGAAPGDICSEAHGINASGQVVGGSGTCHGAVHAFLWEEGGPMMDLNTLIPPGSGLQLNDAASINDRGEIAGVGKLANGEQHAYLLIPCEETASDGEGCDYDLVDATSATQTHPAEAGQAQAAAASTAKLSRAEIMTRIQVSRAGRNRRHGMPLTSPQ